MARTTGDDFDFEDDFDFDPPEPASNEEILDRISDLESEISGNFEQLRGYLAAIAIGILAILYKLYF